MEWNASISGEVQNKSEKFESKENLSSYENICSDRNATRFENCSEETARSPNGPVLSEAERCYHLSPPPPLPPPHRHQHPYQQQQPQQRSWSKKKKLLKINDHPSESLPTPKDSDDDPTSSGLKSKNCLSATRPSGGGGGGTDYDVGLQRNLSSLDEAIKKFHLRLGKKLKRESEEFVPCTSLVKLSCKSPVRSEKVIVFMRVVFLKIGEIDTMKENFAADAFIQARWREPALDGMIFQNPDEIDWGKFWNPKIYIENSYTDPKETIWQTLSFNSKQEATVFERRRIKGSFIENLELDEFPFDTQDLTLTITTERSESELELEEDTDEISSINVQSFVDEQEWKLHSHVETWKKITTKAYQNSKAKHPSFSTSCRATRRPGFFIWNIFLVMLFICSLTFATFCVDLMKPENRLQLSFILLLTTITFKFVVSQTLPRISYLTYLDKYILISMAILCGVCVWHALVFSFLRHDIELAKTVDRWALIISGSSYFLFHVFFFSTIYLVALKKRMKYDKKDKEHKERIKKLQRLQELAKANIPPQEANK